MTRRPLIGITPSPTTSTLPHGTFYRYCLADTYVRAVWQAGGNPVIIPWVADRAAEVLDELDGLILSGGGDVEPAVFNAERHDRTDGIDAERDAFELALARSAVERDLPLLAICRGVQVLNVALGGTLHQHLPDLGDDLEHRQHEAGASQHDASHRVLLENLPNPLHDIAGATEIEANSYHHQALADVAPPLKVAARADDGTIEAVWHPAMRFGLGVQWHPEMLAATAEPHARLFDALVVAARAATPMRSPL